VPKLPLATLVGTFLSIPIEIGNSQIEMQKPEGKEGRRKAKGRRGYVQSNTWNLNPGTWNLNPKPASSRKLSIVANLDIHLKVYLAEMCPPIETKPVQPTTLLELEQEISRICYGIRGRDTRISQALITDLRNRFSHEDVAGVLLVSLERLVWIDPDAVVWAIDHLIPTDVMQAIRQITSLAVSKQLVDAGMLPGTDFSVDGTGKLLLNDKASRIVERFRF
jgi:hypothetical protein